MEKTARKPSTDPVQERLRQNKANWNKEVSAFINDLIHLKKTMNGWPSKFFKERSRIADPIPADPTTIIGSLAGDFQDIVNKGNAVVQEQLNYAKNRRKRQMKQLPLPIPEAPKTPAAPAAPATPTEPSRQLELALSSANSELVKLASSFEDKYVLKSEASNPFSRFITKLFSLKYGLGFGEGARIRQLRMTMLDSCVKAYKALKHLQKEIVKSSKESVVNSHKMTTMVWNYWNIVNRLFYTYKAIRPGEVKDQGGEIQAPELEKEEKGAVAPSDTKLTEISTQRANKLADYRKFGTQIVSKSPAAKQLNSLAEFIQATPKEQMASALASATNIDALYAKALAEVNAELGYNEDSFEKILLRLSQDPTKAELLGKTAQLKHLRKLRHQVIPGATSRTRLEIYSFIDQIKHDLDRVMNLLEEGFDQEQLTTAVLQVNRQMTTLRTMMRSLYYAQKPEEAGSPFF